MSAGDRGHPSKDVFHSFCSGSNLNSYLLLKSRLCQREQARLTKDMEWHGKQIGAGAFARKGHLSLSWDFLVPRRSTNNQNADQFWAGKFTAGIPGITICSYSPWGVCVCLRRGRTGIIYTCLWWPSRHKLKDRSEFRISGIEMLVS